MLHPDGYRELSSLAGISFEPGLAASDQASDATIPATPTSLMHIHLLIVHLRTHLCKYGYVNYRCGVFVRWRLHYRLLPERCMISL